MLQKLNLKNLNDIKKNECFNTFGKNAELIVKISKSKRKNAKSKYLHIYYMNKDFQKVYNGKLKKHITHFDLLNAIDFINVNKYEYKYIQLYFLDIINNRNNSIYYYSIESFISDFIKYYYMLDNTHGNPPKFYTDDMTGATDNNIKYLINKYYDNDINIKTIKTF